MIPRTVFFLAMAAFGASSCSARSDGYVSSAYHWNQDDGEFRSAVLVAEDCALGGDSVAVRDLIMLSGLTDGDRSEVVGESLSKIWDKRGPGDFFSGVGFVPWPILDALP